MSCLRNKGLSALAFEKTPEQSKILTRPHLNTQLMKDKLKK